MDIEQANKLVGGVLSVVGVQTFQQDYFDYKQELLILVCKAIEANEDISLENNPMLFNFLKWRLLDMLRKTNRDGKRVEPTDELPLMMYNDWDNCELRTVIESYMETLDKTDVSYQLMNLYLNRPRLSHERLLQDA